jgi:hypothetical protein
VGLIDRYRFDRVSLWSFNVGRAPTINVEDYRTPLPVPRKEDDDHPWTAEGGSLQTSDPSNLNVDIRPGWRSSCLLWTAMLIKIANDIHRAL